MAGIPDTSGEQEQTRQRVLDYFSDHLDSVCSAEEVADAIGLSVEDTEIAVEALAYEKEIAKEYVEGGQKVYRRKA